MKKLFTLMSLVLFVLSAQAHVFEDKVDLGELSDGMIECAQDLPALNKYLGYTSSVVGKTTKVSKMVQVKTIVVSTRLPRGFGHSDPGPVLTITTKVTQPPVGSFDIPSRSETECSVK